MTYRGLRSGSSPVQVSTLASSAGSKTTFKAKNVHFAERVLGLATAQTPNGNSGRVALDHLFAALLPQLQVESTLDDAKQILAFWFGMSSNAAVQPADGPQHCLSHALYVWRSGGNDIVELHHDVASDTVLKGY
jgi:hypothetical protein